MTERRTFGRRPAQIQVSAVARDPFAVLDVVGLGSTMRFGVFVALLAFLAWWLG
jgi:hypothetical protein